MFRLGKGSLLRASAFLVRKQTTSSLLSKTRFTARTPAAATQISIIRHYSVTTSGEFTPEEVDQLSANEYHRISEDYLETLTDHLVELGQDHPQVDAEYSHGVLNLDLPPNGSYVINKQPPNKQIWLSSPISGPDRFDPIGRKWISLRTKEALGDVLRRELKEALSVEVALEGIDDE